VPSWLDAAEEAGWEWALRPRQKLTANRAGNKTKPGTVGDPALRSRRGPPWAKDSRNRAQAGGFSRSGISIPCSS
jgi:hypothetical protein